MSSGYSGTPQARKLGLKPGLRVSLDDPPDGWQLTDPPGELSYVETGQPADVVVALFRSADELPARLPELVERIYPAGALWIAWPRKAAGHQSDLTDNVVREAILRLGVVDTKIAAIDDDWSGQRVVWRLENRTR